MRTLAQGRQISRADFENRTPIAETLSSKIIKSFSESVDSLSGVIIEDYNKGLLTEPFIHEVLTIAKEAGLKVLVDPKFDNFFAYEGVTLFKPNLRELAEATSMKVSNVDEIRRAAQDLKKRLKCENVMVTMGKDGVGLLDSSESFHTLPAFVRIVNDPAGAGDTVISVMASAIASGSSVKDAMTVANYGGGIICEKVGIQTVSLEELQASIMRNGV
jgi:rfaE bifunctional protein kinase chain/domain